MILARYFIHVWIGVRSCQHQKHQNPHHHHHLELHEKD